MKELILSIETSGKQCSVALHDRGALLATHQTKSSGGPLHSDRLAEMVGQLFKESQEQEDHLLAVAISAGPGSYTGLRIGTAFAKGIAFGLDIPLIQLNSLEVILSKPKQLRIEGHWIALSNAQKGHCFVRVMSSTGELIDAPSCLPMQEADFLPWISEGYGYFLGYGAATYAEAIETWRHSFVLPGIQPEAQHMGHMAYNAFQQEHFAYLPTFSPLYQNTPVAN